MSDIISDFKYRLAKLKVKPGDFLVFKTDQRLDRDQTEFLRHRIYEQMPDGCECMILMAGFDVMQIAGKDVPLEWIDEVNERRQKREDEILNQEHPLKIRSGKTKQ